MRLDNHASSLYLQHTYESSLLCRGWEGVLRDGLLPGNLTVYERELEESSNTRTHLKAENVCIRLEKFILKHLLSLACFQTIASGK